MSRKLSRAKATWLVWLLPLLLILGACATGKIREKILTLPVIEGATYVGQETCAGCHDQVAAGFATSIHGRLAEFELMGAEGGCEACHGAGSLHAASSDYGQILKFGELAADEAAAVCVKCHSSGSTMDWTHGEHALADVGCGDCHAIHQGSKKSLKKADPELCYGCHQEIQAKASFPSHHPVKEGKMTCSDCHNPHGALRTEETLNDLCYNCHSRFQGPFVFEHAPVQEDCSICHDPHGTVANNLLKQNEPFICLQCHESHFHALRIGATRPTGNVAWSATDREGNINTLPPSTGNTLAAADSSFTVPIQNAHGAEGWQMAFGTKCTVCHSVVHGSDLPSQTAPTVDTTNARGWPDSGKGLTR